MGNNDVKILLSATDKASKTINNINESLGKGPGGMASMVTMASTAFMAFAPVIKDVTKELEKIVTDTVDYNKQIRELCQVTGLGADEMSRIVQVGDDWGISLEQIRTSLEYANKNGMSPTIDNLAKLADEYINTANKTEFATKAQKLFGRQYADIIPLLAKGGDSLREQAASQNKNLLATEESIKASREYEVAMDNLEDAVKGVGYSLGNDLIPPVTKATIELNKFIDIQQTAPAILEKYNTLIEAGAIKGEKLYQQTMMYALGVKTAEEAIKKINISLEAYYDIANESNKIDDIRASRFLPDATQATEDYTDATKRAAIALADLSKAGLAKDAINEMSKAYEDGTLASDVYHNKVAQLMRDYLDMPEAEITAELALQNLKEQLADGEITAGQYSDQIRNLIAQLNNLDGKKVTVHITTYHEDMFAKHNYQHGANFVVPPGYPNDTFPMNVSSGEHVIVTPAPQINNNNQQYHLHTNAAANILRDFNIMKAMAG